jgi:hypothetical protein
MEFGFDAIRYNTRQFRITNTSDRISGWGKPNNAAPNEHIKGAARSARRPIDTVFDTLYQTPCHD